MVTCLIIIEQDPTSTNLKVGVKFTNKDPKKDEIEYAADLGSSNEDYDYNDPYLYLLTSFQQSVDNFIYEDDDGNEDVEEGLFFYLSDITFTNNLIALVTSYDPEVKGTADFTITSNNQLYIIPEPLAISLIATSGLTLLIIKRKFL